MDDSQLIIIQRLAYYLQTFGENVSKIDQAIDLLKDLKDELDDENVDLHTIGIADYVSGSLARLKACKKDLSNDIQTIKNNLSLLTNSKTQV